MEYLAHIDGKRKQSNKEHLYGTAMLTGDFAEAARSVARQHFLRPFRQGRGAYGMHRPQTRRQKRVRRIGG